MTTSVLLLSAGLSLRNYDLLTLRAHGPIGASEITIFDTRAMPRGHDVTTILMSASGQSVSTRVGSCHRWHGYSSTRLYVQQAGGAAISGFWMAGVAG